VPAIQCSRPAHSRDSGPNNPSKKEIVI
jgi:hypothetical protein